MGNPFERVINTPAADSTDNPFARLSSSAPTSAAPAAAPAADTSHVAPSDIDELRRDWWNSVRNAPWEPPRNGDQDYDLADIPGAAAHNFFPSIWKGLKAFGSNVADHPLDTMLSLLPSKQHKLDLINTIWDRYGSWDNAKRTAAENPASVLMDAGTIGAFAPETKLGRLVGYVDPAMATKLPGKVVEAAGTGTGKLAQLATQSEHGVNGAALRDLFDSGEKITPGVWETLTKGMDKDKITAQLGDILSDLYGERRNNYINGMQSVAGHDTPIDFSKIDAAVNKASGVGVYKAPKDTTLGPGYNFEKNQSIKDARGEILGEIERFRQLGPAYHTAEGFDKLKQAVQQIGENMKEANGMPSRGSTFANTIADSIVKTVSKEAPEYGAVMQAYHDDSNQIRNLMREFSTGKPGSNPITTLKKLQSVYRNHANLGYGARADFLKDVAQRTGNDSLMPQLAADEFHSWTPRGLRGAALGLDLAMNAPAAIGHMFVNPLTGLAHLGTAAGTAALLSPRLMGTAAYGAGRAAPYLRPLGRAYQNGVRPALPWIARDAHNQPDELTEPGGGFFSGR